MVKDNVAKEQWLTIYKGIGILLVIMEHCMPSSSNIFARILLMFHMPLFFFCSGYCFHTELTAINIKKWRKSTFLYSFIIYIIFSIVGFAWYLLNMKNTVGFLRKPILFNLINILYCNQIKGKLVSGGMWFVVTLTMTKLIFSFLWGVKKLSNTKFFQLIMIYTIIMCSLNVHKYSVLPLCLDNVKFSIIFFSLGVLIKKLNIIKFIQYELNCFSKLIVMCVSITILVIMSKNNPISVMMHENLYGNYIYFFLGSISGILSIVLVSLTIMYHNNILSKGFSYIGYDTIYYFVMQFISIDIARIILNKLLLYTNNAWINSFILFMVTLIILIIINKILQSKLTPIIKRLQNYISDENDN